MKFWQGAINIYFKICLAGAFLLVAGNGCGTSHFDTKKHEYATIRLYLESTKGDSSGGGMVEVTRMKIPMYIEREPFLTEENLSQAALIEHPDGTFGIRLVFNDHGSLVLQMTTLSSKGSRIAVMSQFPPRGWKPPKNTDMADATNAPGTPRISGWLAAVLIRDGISNGTFEFTPDATQEEAARIVRGLNNVAKEEEKLSR